MEIPDLDRFDSHRFISETDNKYASLGHPETIPEYGSVRMPTAISTEVQVSGLLLRISMIQLGGRSNLYPVPIPLPCLEPASSLR